MIEQREGGGVGADAKRDHEDGREREARRSPEHAEPVANVVDQRFEPDEHPGLARRLLDAGAIAELAPGGFERRVLAHPAIAARLHFHLQMRIELGSQILVETIAAREPAKLGPPLAHG